MERFILLLILYFGFCVNVHADSFRNEFVRIAVNDYGSPNHSERYKADQDYKIRCLKERISYKGKFENNEKNKQKNGSGYHNSGEVFCALFILVLFPLFVLFGGVIDELRENRNKNKKNNKYLKKIKNAKCQGDVRKLKGISSTPSKGVH